MISTFDIIIIVVYVLLIVVIGINYGYKKSNNGIEKTNSRGYFLAGMVWTGRIRHYRTGFYTG